jgi:hypothetical protein
VVGAELVGVENGEGGGKKATRSSRHQIGAVCVFFRSRVLFFFFHRFHPTLFLVCFEIFHEIPRQPIKHHGVCPTNNSNSVLNAEIVNCVTTSKHIQCTDPR